MSGVSRIATAIAVAILILVISRSVIAEEAPVQVASLAEPLPPVPLPLDFAVRGDEPFGLSGRIKPRPMLGRKWDAADRAIRDDLAAIEKCRAEQSCTEAQSIFTMLVDTARSESRRALLGVVNRSVNLAVVATTDFAQFGVEDVWSSPLETLTTGRGDCEDYAILKIAVLRAAGLDADDLRLVVVRDPVSHEGHAVAAVRFEGRWLLLDNRRFALVDAADSPYRAFFALRVQGGPDRNEVAQGSAGAATPYLL